MEKGKGEWKEIGEGKEERGIKVEKEKKEKEKKKRKSRMTKKKLKEAESTYQSKSTSGTWGEGNIITTDYRRN